MVLAGYAERQSRNLSYEDDLRNGRISLVCGKLSNGRSWCETRLRQCKASLLESTSPPSLAPTFEKQMQRRLIAIASRHFNSVRGVLKKKEA